MDRRWTKGGEARSPRQGVARTEDFEQSFLPSVIRQQRRNREMLPFESDKTRERESRDVFPPKKRDPWQARYSVYTSRNIHHSLIARHDIFDKTGAWPPRPSSVPIPIVFPPSSPPLPNPHYTSNPWK